MSLYYCWVTKMANAVVLWVLVYLCVTSVNTKDRSPGSILCVLLFSSHINDIVTVSKMFKSLINVCS